MEPIISSTLILPGLPNPAERGVAAAVAVEHDLVADVEEMSADPDGDGVPERRVLFEERREKGDLPDLFSCEHEQEEVYEEEAQAEALERSPAPRISRLDRS
jgi:hypothetical protein